jgi:hypothetical protein
MIAEQRTQNEMAAHPMPTVRVSDDSQTFLFGCEPGSVDFSALPQYLTTASHALNLGIDADSIDRLVATLHGLREAGMVDWLEVPVASGEPLSQADTILTFVDGISGADGSIRHAGTLMVFGDIQPGSVVVTGGDLHVHGKIDRAQIEVLGNLTVNGGIIGNSKCSIQVRGGVCAQFIEMTEIESDGDIVVERWIDGSTIRTRGAVRIPAGLIVNSRIEALCGIEAGQSGSAIDGTTELCVGTDPALPRRLFKMELEQATLTQAFEENMSKLRRLQKAGVYTKAQRRAFDRAANDVAEVSEQLRCVNALHATLRREAALRGRNEVRIRGKAFTGTRISMGANHLFLDRDEEGPFHALLTAQGVTLMPGIGPDHGVREFAMKIRVSGNI